MGTLTYLLERMSGEIQIDLCMKNRDALGITLKKKEIVLYVKNPVLVMEAGAETLLKNKGSDTLKKIKDHGYVIKIKYKGLEFNL